MSDLANTGSVHYQDLLVDVEDVGTVERCAAHAWPAQNSTDLAGWALRHSPGVSNRRANSVLPLTFDSNQTLQDAIAGVEQFYFDRDLAARFMVSPAAMPRNIDGVLERLGYHIDAPTKVQWAETSQVFDSCGRSEAVKMLNKPTDDWMSAYMEGVQDAKEIAIKKQLIERIRPDCALAQLNVDGRAAAVGLSVCEQGWVGVFCMHTLVKHRRKGLARQILGGLAHWAQAKGAETMYLQVEADNSVAQKFYETCKFVTQYGYHYRTKEMQRVSQ